jgi:hypothetical protein
MKVTRAPPGVRADVLNNPLASGPDDGDTRTVARGGSFSAPALVTARQWRRERVERRRVIDAPAREAPAASAAAAIFDGDGGGGDSARVMTQVGMLADADVAHERCPFFFTLMHLITARTPERRPR